MNGFLIEGSRLVVEKSKHKERPQRIQKEFIEVWVNNFCSDAVDEEDADTILENILDAN